MFSCFNLVFLDVCDTYAVVAVMSICSCVKIKKGCAPLKHLRKKSRPNFGSLVRPCVVAVTWEEPGCFLCVVVP